MLVKTRFLLSAFAVLALFAHAETATTAYVDQRDQATIRTLRNYVDGAIDDFKWNNAWGDGSTTGGSTSANRLYTTDGTHYLDGTGVVWRIESGIVTNTLVSSITTNYTPYLDVHGRWIGKMSFTTNFEYETVRRATPVASIGDPAMLRGGNWKLTADGRFIFEDGVNFTTNALCTVSAAEALAEDATRNASTTLPAVRLESYDGNGTFYILSGKTLEKHVFSIGSAFAQLAEYPSINFTVEEGYFGGNLIVHSVDPFIASNRCAVLTLTNGNVKVDFNESCSGNASGLKTVTHVTLEDIFTSFDTAIEIYRSGEYAIALNVFGGTTTSSDITATGTGGGTSGGGGTDTDTVRALINSETGGTNALKTAVEKTKSAIVTNMSGVAHIREIRVPSFDNILIGYGTDYSGINLSEWHEYGHVTNKGAVVETMGHVNALSNTVALWQGYWGGDDFRVTITNYDSQTHIPSLFMEDKLTEGGTNFFRKVWDERTRWDAFLGPLDLASWIGFYHWSTNVTAELDQKADRAWGFYDSHTGEYAPEGYTQISSSNILISSGMAYHRTLTAQGAVWVLTANGSAVQTGGMTNGFFRISDDEGNSMFEIVKGSKREVGADASSTSIANVGGLTHMTVVYPVVSDTHPTMYFASSLGGSATWYAETDALCPVTTVWSGSSGNWSVTFHYNSLVVAQPRLYAKAGYMVGGETQIRQSVPVDMQYIILNGQKYALGTASISGNTVLTLTPVN